MATRLALIVLTLGCMLALAERAYAQGDGSPVFRDPIIREIMVKPPDQSPGLMRPPQDTEREREAARGGPGYITPLSSTTPTSRYGAAGWTVNPPTAGARATTDTPGMLGFGFAVEWGASRTESP